MTIAVSKALEAGATTVVCASTGNTAASAAAYASRAGLGAVVLQPHGAVAAARSRRPSRSAHGSSRYEAVSTKRSPRHGLSPIAEPTSS